MKFLSKLLPALLALYLGIHSGQLAMLERGNPKPLEIYPIQVRMLPLSDQLELSEGIEIRSKLHLAQMLEDYLS